MKNPWIEIKRPRKSVNVRLVEAEHPLNLYWGLDAQGKYLFIYDAILACIPSKKSVPSLSGISIDVIPQGERGKMLLVLQENADWELFYSLCMDLHRRTAKIKDESAVPGIILNRLQRWQEFLKRERTRIMPLERIKGLIGELLFMINQLAEPFGWDHTIRFWRGPEDAPQDFAVNDTAVEVKCQSGGSHPTVRINSQDQLTPQLPKGFLVVQTLAGSTESGDKVFNLNSLVDGIRSSLLSHAEETRDRFEELLFMMGYTYSEKYSDIQFTLVATKCYELRDGFPRITSDQIMAGVDKVSYTIGLDDCEEFLGKPDWWSK